MLWKVEESSSIWRTEKYWRTKGKRRKKSIWDSDRSRHEDDALFILSFDLRNLLVMCSKPSHLNRSGWRYFSSPSVVQSGHYSNCSLSVFSNIAQISALYILSRTRAKIRMEWTRCCVSRKPICTMCRIFLTNLLVSVEIVPFGGYVELCNWWRVMKICVNYTCGVWRTSIRLQFISVNSAKSSCTLGDQENA